MDKELLIAIGDMLDSKLKPINESIEGIKQDIKEIRRETKAISEQLESISERATKSEEDIVLLAKVVKENTYDIAKLKAQLL